MLRTQNTTVLENSSNIKYAPVKGKKCVRKEDEQRIIKKRSCDPNADAVKILDDMHRENACKVHSCVPLKKCMAKVGLHDSNGNYLTNELITANLTANLRTGSNQIGYVYQEKSINDSNALAAALRANNPIAASVADKIARSNAELYGKPHAWDGSDQGYFCVKCPPKPKPCPRNICKKADPLFNPEIGIGSDGLEAKRDLREINNAQNFQVRLETAKMETATMETQAVGGPNLGLRMGRGRTIEGPTFDPERRLVTGPRESREEDPRAGRILETDPTRFIPKA